MSTATDSAAASPPVSPSPPQAEPTPAAGATPARTRPLLMLIRREFWEHSTLWMAPLAVAALMLLGALIGTVYLTAGLAPAPEQRRAMFEIAVIGFNFPELITLSVIIWIYAADCLYTERRDRSILFWKSMPVSDARTVLSKVLVAMVVLPLGVFLLTCVSSLLACGLYAVRSLAGQVPAAIWDTGIWLRVEGASLALLVASVLWYAPLIAYTLLVSAWARRGVWTWLLLPPLVVALLEQIVLGTHRLWAALAYRLELPLRHLGIGGATADTRAITDPGAAMNQAFASFTSIDLGQLLANVDLWLGLAATAVFVAGAIRVRRYRDDS